MYATAIEIITRSDIKRLVEMAVPIYSVSLSELPEIIKIIASGNTPDPDVYTEEQITAANEGINRINIAIEDMSIFIDNEIKDLVTQPTSDFLKIWCCLLVENEICQYESDHPRAGRLDQYQRVISNQRKDQSKVGISFSFSSETRRSYL